MGQRVVEIEGLAKRYRLGQLEAVSTTLKEALTSTLRGGGRGDRRRPRDLWALRDVDLSIDQGEVVGIIGRNGSGKSTLLKILARITEPTLGVARTRGRVGALLEVGTGFHLELTGRENVYLNGALIGMRRAEIRRRFDEIVEFAGVERFLDTPLKRYSSGMNLRLAFAVAAHLDPEIVVVDEVLAVGDVDFQQKCLGKMSDLRREGRTVVFVSHDLGAVARLCRRVVWLDSGRVRADGPGGEVIDGYLRTAAPGRSEVLLRPDTGALAHPTEVALTGDDGTVVEAPVRGDPLTVRVRLRVTERIPGLDLAVWVVGRHGARLLDEALLDEPVYAGALDGPGELSILLRLPPVLPHGEYVVGLWLGTEWEDFFDEQVLRFRLAPAPGEREASIGRGRLAQPPVNWEVFQTEPTGPPGVPFTASRPRGR